MTPLESETVTGLAPRSSSFSTVYCETLPLPETRQSLPRRIFAALQHFVGEIDAAVASGFRTNQRTAPAQTLAGEDAGEFIAEALVLAKQETDLASAHADVAGRDVGVRADVALQFGHEALAEAHDFVVTLAFGIEIGTALAAAHGQRGERILENLFKRQELQDARLTEGSKRSPPL